MIVILWEGRGGGDGGTEGVVLFEKRYWVLGFEESGFEERLRWRGCFERGGRDVAFDWGFSKVFRSVGIQRLLNEADALAVGPFFARRDENVGDIFFYSPCEKSSCLFGLKIR